MLFVDLPVRMISQIIVDFFFLECFLDYPLKQKAHIYNH